MTDIDLIKSRVNIVDIVGERVRLKKSGANYFGLCPFHQEDSPSFSVNENIQIYKCFGCNESGDVFSFLTKYENIEFREALEMLADRVGFKLSKSINKTNQKELAEIDKLFKVNAYVSSYYQKKLLTGENQGLVYARKRNLDESLIYNFGIGYAGENKLEVTTLLRKKNLSDKELVAFGISTNKEGKIQDKYRSRLIFTIYNEKGQTVGFSGRFIGKENPNFKPPKYLNSPETLVFKKSTLLFGLYQARDSIKKMNFVLVTEGQMNAISSHRVGVKNIVAPLGTSFTEQHLKILSRYTKKIFLCFDRDNAGKKALIRTLELIFKTDLDVKVVSWDETVGKDPDEVISQDPQIWLNAVNNPLDPIEFLYHEFNHKYTNKTLDRINSFLKLVLKLVAAHLNKVKKEYYLNYLSEELGLSKTSLQEAIQQNTYFIRDTKKLEVTKRRLNAPIKKVLQKPVDKIFAILVQNWEESRGLLEIIEREYLPRKYLELFDCLSLFSDENSIKNVRECVDEKLLDLFDTLSHQIVPIDDSIPIEKHIMQLLPLCKKEYQKHLIEKNRYSADLDSLEKINKIVHDK